MAEIVILGAGLTGLSTAYHLEKNGFFDYVLFEQCQRPGGLAKSERYSGFTFDYTGHFLHLTTEYGRQMVDNILGLDGCQLHERRAAIFSHGRYIPYPFQAHLNGLPSSVIIDCIEGFIKRKKNGSPATFYTWVLKHFGKGLAEHFFVPYNEKLFDYPAKKLHHSWTGRFVPQVTLASLLQGALEGQTQKMGYNSSFYYPRYSGIEVLPATMVKGLGNSIMTNHTAVNIDPIGKKITFSNGKSERYRLLVSTIPLDALLTCVRPWAATLVHHAQKKLLCTSVLSVNLGLATRVSDSHWVYYPERQFPFYRVGFWHNVSQALVPDHASALFAEVGFRRSADYSIQRVTDTTVTALAKLFRFSSNDIVLHKNLLLDHAYVIYDAWRERNIQGLLDYLRCMSIYSIGRYGAWKYASMEEALLDGRDVSDKILKALKYPKIDRAGRLGKKGLEGIRKSNVKGVVDEADI
ncbi:MAG: FAD-dependent oxidoreductase [Candidatus Babeliales bacterium]